MKNKDRETRLQQLRDDIAAAARAHAEARKSAISHLMDLERFIADMRYVAPEEYAAGEAKAIAALRTLGVSLDEIRAVAT